MIYYERKSSKHCLNDEDTIHADTLFFNFLYHNLVLEHKKNNPLQIYNSSGIPWRFFVYHFLKYILYRRQLGKSRQVVKSFPICLDILPNSLVYQSANDIYPNPHICYPTNQYPPTF